MNQKEIGKRLKEIREKHYAKFKLSLTDIAEELSEKMFNIANYEAGKANLPNRVMVALYDKGFNPSYILTGEGSIYANNAAGKERVRQSDEESDLEQATENVDEINMNKMSIDELFDRAVEYSAAADDIMKYLKKRRKEDIDR